MGVNLVQAWSSAKARLSAVGLASPAIDARLLLEAAADVTRTVFPTKRPPSMFPPPIRRQMSPPLRMS